MVQYRRAFTTPRSGVTKEGTMIYRASKLDCNACTLKAQCCPNDLPARSRGLCMKPLATRLVRIATTQYVSSRRQRKKVEMLFAHLKRILGLGMRLRGPTGAKDEFLLAATAQNLRKLAKTIPSPEPIFAT